MHEPNTAWFLCNWRLQTTKNPEVLKTLIKAGANLDAREKNGSTPLHLAASSNKNPEVLKTLINAGASLKARTKDGLTFLDFMEQNKALKGSQLYWELRDAQYNQ